MKTETKMKQNHIANITAGDCIDLLSNFNTHLNYWHTGWGEFNKNSLRCGNPFKRPQVVAAVFEYAGVNYLELIDFDDACAEEKDAKKKMTETNSTYFIVEAASIRHFDFKKISEIGFYL